MAEQVNPVEKLPRRVIAFRLLLVHYGIYALTNMILLTINALTTPGNWWFLWVVGGWGIVIAAHAGFFVRGLAGAHLMTFIVAAIGLTAIDLIYSDRRWFYWPLLPWLIFLILHLMFASNLRRRYLDWEATLAQAPPNQDPKRGP